MAQKYFSGRYFLILIVTLFTLGNSWAVDCPNISLNTPLEIGLNENELSLLCPKVDGKRQSIPHYQAKFYLRGFLQSRGHLAPSFNANGPTLEVTSHKKSYLKKVDVKSEELKSEILRFYAEKIVTPPLLDSIEEFISEYYREEGHPCPKISTSYSPQESSLSIEVNNLERKNFGAIKYEKIKDLNPNFIKRFEAFKETQLYNPNKIELSKKRALRSNVVQSTYYQKNCGNNQEEFNIKQSFVPGPPRTLRFGIGANTEVGPMVRLKWANHRFGDMASTLEAKLQASFKEQSFSVGADFFLWEDSPRRSWKSEFQNTRTSESDFEEITSKVSQKIKWTHDTTNEHWIWQTGPAIVANWFETDSDKSRRSLVNPSWQASLQAQSHNYELYDLFPQQGHMLKLSTDLRPTWLNNKFDIYQFSFRSVKLIPMMKWGRGNLVAGFRGNFESTWVEDSVDISSLPPGLRYYGGGENSNRGRRLNSLPKNNGLGALSHALVRAEIRRTYAFVPELEILLFSDFSMFSERAWRVEETIWASPGLGVRWLSPIGPVQAYAAKSLKYRPNEDDGFHFYIGLGGEL
jgi:translocation and assembly module TamA